MTKIDITIDKWIEIHKELRSEIPSHHIAKLKKIFEIHKNEEMIQTMQEIKESIQSNKIKCLVSYIENC